MFTRNSKWVFLIGGAAGAFLSLMMGISVGYAAASSLVYRTSAGVLLGIFTVLTGFLLTAFLLVIYGVLAEISYKFSDNKAALAKMNNEAPDVTEMNVLTGKRYDPTAKPVRVPTSQDSMCRSWGRTQAFRVSSA